MSNTRILLFLLAAVCLAACSSFSPGTTAALGAGITGAIAGLQHALATGAIDPELGGNLLAALTVVQQQMGEHAAVAAAATKVATDVGAQLATTQSTLSDIQMTGMVTGGLLTAYAGRKPAAAIALGVVRAMASTQKPK